MIFSSNQILQISGCLDHKNELEKALEFAISFDGYDVAFTKEGYDRGCRLSYQITKDGKYCIGWGDTEDGWTEYQFRPSVTILSEIIRQHLEDFPVEDYGYDGSYDKGFLIKAIDETMADEWENIKKPFYGIISIEPYTCFYSK